jgi:hypothetical protein
MMVDQVAEIHDKSSRQFVCPAVRNSDPVRDLLAAHGFRAGTIRRNEMRFRMVRRGAVLALAAVAALLAGVAPASAAPGAGSAYGVRVAVTLLGSTAVEVGPLAEAKTSGPTTATVVSATVPGVLRTGVITTSAHRNADTGEVDAAASTADVGVPLLAALGVVHADVVSAKCDATQSGVTGSSSLVDARLGSLGTVAATPAANTEISVRLPIVGNVATVLLNEQVHNADGSLTVNAIHVHLLGGGGLGSIGSGDVIVSSATCGPAALPIPMASGAGLWIGLGLLGAVAVPVGTTAIRRRRGAATAA